MQYHVTRVTQQAVVVARHSFNSRVMPGARYLVVVTAVVVVLTLTHGYYYIRYILLQSMQSVATGKAPPITLKWKITLGGKQNKKQKMIYTISETNRAPQTEKVPQTENNKVRSA